MSDLITMLSAASGAGGAEEADEYFNQTTLLLHGDGTDGAQNNTFLDSSTNNFTITRNGNTTQGTFSPFSNADGQWSNYFDGVTDYLYDNTLNTAYDFGLGDFTIEAWLYPQASGIQMVFVTYAPLSGSPPATSFSYLFRIVNTNKLTFSSYSGSSLYEVQDPTNMTLNTWTHVAVTRESGTLRLFRNGTQVATTTANVSINASDASRRLQIGTYNLYGQTDEFNGYISNVRIVKGTAVYTSAFTPPTAPLTAIANTSLLTCQSNRFVDNSINNFAITRNGNTSTQPFSPFAPSAAYSTSVNGGSGYFDGTGDYLSVPSNAAFDLGSGAFTFECFINPAAAVLSRIISRLSGSAFTFQLGLQANRSIIFQGQWNGSSYNFSLTTAASIVSLNSWAHIAVVRDGANAAIFIDGVRQANSTTISGSFGTAGTINIGRNEFDGGIQYFNGFISSLRVLKGTAVYDPTQTTITTPTAPLTAIANTSLLCNFTNAGIFDNTGKNNLETVGNAQIDTTTKKYGTGSMEFDGTGDWLLMPNTPDQQLGTGNFTIEFWVYLASGDTGSNRGLVAKGTSTTGFLVSLNTTEKVVFTYATSTITSSGAITTNAWNHIAVVREGTGSNQTKIYIGGTNDGTGTVSTDFNQTSVMYVGANRTGGDPMKGFIDDLRITKGVARYTTTFTPPTKEFPNL